MILALIAQSAINKTKEIIDPHMLKERLRNNSGEFAKEKAVKKVTKPRMMMTIPGFSLLVCI